MAIIALNKSVVTTINTFTVAPENQERALELLVEIARMLRKEVPGFLAAHFHKSIDGTRVVNYAQYDSREALEAATTKIFERSDLPLLTEIRRIATPDACEYEVCVILEG